ncbi:MAG TPA: hypothetical protein VM409_06880 [Chloroflexia bacterium]|nr:hypothetical protein [Chloroflexia bacterium]
MSEENDGLVVIWRKIIVGEGKSWVLFKHGTCVILTDAATDPASEAIAFMKEWGPVVVGTPSADFDVVKLRDDPGWVVTYNHPDLMSYVGPDEFEGQEAPDDMFIGLLGRTRRRQDADELEIVHTER